MSDEQSVAEIARSECSCLSKADEKLAPAHSLDVAFMWAEGGLVARPYSKVIRKDNGKPETRSGRPSIFAFSHCPFCGVAYPKDTPNVS